MKHTRIVLTSLFLAPVLALNSCETATGTGALAGAAGGAALGGLLGGGKGRNIAAGAILGAGTGALVGHMVDRSNANNRQLPYGRAVGNGMVESPYAPHNLIDVRGIPHGAVVQDPSTGGRFIKP